MADVFGWLVARFVLCLCTGAGATRFCDREFVRTTVRGCETVRLLLCGDFGAETVLDERCTVLLPLDLEPRLLTGVLLVGDNRALSLLRFFLVCVCLVEVCLVEVAGAEATRRVVRVVWEVRVAVPLFDRPERSLLLLLALRLRLTDRFCCLAGVDGVIRFFDFLPEVL